MSAQRVAIRELYPGIEPYRSGFFEVDATHRLYVEECGNSDGVPVVYLHGGPGSGCTASQRRFFDPERCRIILYDQRGSGRSQPLGCLVSNTTAHLLADLEALRCHLGVERWILFGGSWGATLALLYAQIHPRHVAGLVLRAVFLARARDSDWFFGANGAAHFFPQAYQAFIEPLEENMRSNPVAGYYRLMTGDDADRRLAAASAWHAWEHQLVCHTLPGQVRHEPDPVLLLARAAVASHYAQHGFFLGRDGALPAAGQLSRIPGAIVHGRRDLVCPLDNARTLRRRWPEAGWTVLNDCGHAAAEPAMRDALMRAVAIQVQCVAAWR